MSGSQKDESKKTSAGSVIKLILLYIGIYLVCSLMFVGLFHTGLLKSMDVLMYRGIAFIVLTGLVAAIVMGVIRKFWKFVTIRDIIMMLRSFPLRSSVPYQSLCSATWMRIQTRHSHRKM